MKKAFLILLCLIAFAVSPIHAQEAEATYSLAAKYYQTQSYAEAEKIWTELSDSGNANAQYALAIMHLKKEASNSNDKTAFTLLKRAAAQKHVVAIFNLGVAYWEGTGTPINQGKALNWWEIAAQKQDSGAQYNLGLAYYIGAGRAEDSDKAYYWVKQAAENGHPQAPSLLRSMTAPTEISSVTKSSENSDNLANKTQANLQNTTPQEPEKKITNSVEVANTASPSPTNETPPEEKPTFLRTIHSTTQLYSLADLKSHVVSTLTPGTLIQQLETDKEWSKVQTPKGAIAWVYETFVNTDNNKRGKIVGTNVNIRPAPSTDNSTSAPIARLNEGDRIQILAINPPWIKIRAARPIPAWIETKKIEKYTSLVTERKKAWLEQSK